MILFLSTNDTLGGAGMVTFRLVGALRQRGIDARMLVGRNDSHEPWVATISPLRRKTAKIAERGEVFVNNGFNMADLWKVSTGHFGAGVSSHPWVKQADVIVIGWINQGFMSLTDIKRIIGSGKKILWMMHDLWCATGICHLPGECSRFKDGCGHCTLLHRKQSACDLSRRVWRRKNAIWGNGENPCIKFLAVSRWQRDMAASSALLSGHTISVLPHAFPVEEFTAGTSPRKKMIVMGAARLDDPIKDLPMAIEALNILKKNHPAAAAGCEAVFFGNIRNAAILNSLELPWQHLGPIDSAALRKLFSEAAVVLSTSKFETMGATLMEGMASGVTPVTFGRGGQTDIVTHGVNGYIADYGSAESIAGFIAKAITSPFPPEAQHASVASRFSADAVATRFLTLISEL